MLKGYLPAIRKLVLLSAFCVCLEALRMLFTSTAAYIFLPYNLLLAWVPVWFCTHLFQPTSKLRFALIFTGWLLFFPNAPYIITDLLHLKPRAGCPFWYDSMLIYAHAFTGFILGMLSAIIIYARLRQFIKPLFARGIMLFAMLASGYGIYIGRFLRWNSWDVVLNPFSLVADMARHLMSPAQYPGAYGVTLVTGVLLYLSFLLFESFIQGEERVVVV
jgi:uncharacterized membrane protein